MDSINSGILTIKVLVIDVGGEKIAENYQQAVVELVRLVRIFFPI